MRRLSIVLIVLAAFCVSGWAERAKGLVAHWDFDEGKGDVLHDISGNKNDGKIRGAKWVKCGKGYALRFDGKDDYVDCGNGKSLDVTGPITLEAWVYPEAVPERGEPGIVGKFYESYTFTYYANGACYWYISGGGNNCRTPLAVGSWYHVVGTFDGATMRLYVNGKAEGFRKSQFKTVKSGKNFFMGCIVGDPTAADPAYHGTAHFDGMIDQVRVYNRVLSDKEIVSHHNASAAEKGGRLLDTSWFDRFRLTPYFYPDEDKLLLNVDFRGHLPVREGAEIRVELARPGEEKPLQSHKIEPRPQPGHVEVAFALGPLAQGAYEVRAILKDKTGARSVEKLAFPYPPPPPQVPAPETKRVGPLPKPLEPVTFNVELCDGGGFKVLVKGDAYPVESTFSYPHGGENTLLASSQKGPACEPSWKVTTQKVGGKEYRVQARGGFYAVDRRIGIHPDHVAVSDTITNLTDKEIGIILSNHLNTRGRNLPACSLAGIKGWATRPALHNPTAFVGKPNLGLGFVAIDDVYVVQGKVFRDKERAGISDDMFGLGPKASYTMTWAIYPVGSDDYFDFINVVRDDLGLSGKTVDGGFSFTARRSPPSQGTVDLLALKYLSIGCLGKVADDPALSLEGIEFIDFPKECALLKKTFAETKKKFPHAKVMFHIAHSLYTTNKPERYADSRVIKPDGKQVRYTNRATMEKYFSKERLDQGWDWYIFYPTLENSFGKAMLRAVDVMMDEIGVTGVWADGLMALFAGNFTYDRWDGHTVEIDPETKTVKRKYASLHLLCQDAIMAYCKRIASKGGVVICDSGPGTLTFARNAAVAAYPVETGADEPCAKTHLAPFPMALGHPRFKPEPQLYRDIQAKLNWGVLYYYYYGSIGRSTILSKIYPFTFEEIHSGYVKGRERLLTALSGAYGWRGDRHLHFAHLSDGRGFLVPRDFLTTVDPSGVRTEISLREGEMVVLKKIPLTIQSKSPINLVAGEYDGKAIELLLNGTGKIVLTIRSGDFPIKPKSPYTVTTFIRPLNDRLGTRWMKKSADKDGVLTVSLMLDGQQTVTIERAVIGDIIGHWNFNEGQGTVLRDSSPNENHGALRNATWAKTADGHALQFGRSGSYVDFGDNRMLKTAGDITIAAWVKLTAAAKPDGTTNYTIVDCEVFEKSGFLLRIDGSRGHMYFRTSQAGGHTGVPSRLALKNDTLHHVVVTKRGNVATYFLDGVQDNSFSAKPPARATASFKISNTSQSFNGLITDLKLYARALSAAEVTREYKRGPAK